jgi:formylglycine-generating enzyme required for sulfatase activity
MMKGNRRAVWIVLISLVAMLSSCSPPNETGGEVGSAGSQSNESAFAVPTSSGVEMVFIPAGSFSMGTDKEELDEAPAHTVAISSFLMDKFEVYHELFVKAELPNPSHWQDNPRKPLEQIRWRDAKLYCNERSLMEGLEPCYDETTVGWPCDYGKNGYRLPTEAEWEYAARAGSTGKYDFGQVSKLKQYAWFEDNAQAKTYPVGVKKPNKWGLHDMYGNVSEWCQDVYSPDYYKESGPTDPKGPAESASNMKRVMRGGSWKSSAAMCRVTFRQGQQTGDSDACFYTDFCGFRCVRPIDVDGARALAGNEP